MKFSLAGVSGNIHSIMEYVINSMEECKISEEEQFEYMKNVFCSDYNNLLNTSLKMIEKCNRIIEK